MALWPATLPQTPRYSGFSQSEQSNTLRSPMGYGPAKSRRQTTAVINAVNCDMILSATQKDTLIAFYITDTVSGSISFDWVDHLNGGAASYRFTGAIRWRSVGCDKWLAVLPLEILP